MHLSCSAYTSLWNEIHSSAPGMIIEDDMSTKPVQTCDSEDSLNTLSTDAVVHHALVLPAGLHHRLLDDQRAPHVRGHQC